jgi:hypothetical protein
MNIDEKRQKINELVKNANLVIKKKRKNERVLSRKEMLKI